MYVFVYEEAVSHDFALLSAYCPEKASSALPCLYRALMPAVMALLADHAARQLLDFNQKLDINLLDNVVNCLYHGVGPQVRIQTSVCGVALSGFIF